MRMRRASLRLRWLGAGGWGAGWGGVAGARRERSAGRMACGADEKGGVLVCCLGIKLAEQVLY